MRVTHLARDPRVLRLGLLLPLCAAVAACAQQPTTALTSHHKFKLRANRALYWEVTRPGQVEPSAYLLGSIHVFHRRITLDRSIEAALDRSRVLAVEIDTYNRRETGLPSVQALMLPFGTTLEQELSADTLELLKQRIDESDFSEDERTALLKMRPWALFWLVSWEEQHRRRQFRSKFGVDRYFWEHSRGKERLGLESWSDRFDSMREGTREEQDAALRVALSPSPSTATLESLALAWMAGDADALEQMAFSDGDARAYIEKGNRLRNSRMANGIESLIEDDRGPVFVVVGAAHLIGADSIVGMLQERGYDVRRGTRKATGQPPRPAAEPR